jgi:four helix bundle protein
MIEERKNEDPLLRYPAYVKALEVFDLVMDDTDLLMHDVRGQVIMRQKIRSAGSISANFEEGYGQGTTSEFVHSLRIANGEARETKGWYRRAKHFLSKDLIDQRMQKTDEIIALTSSMIGALLKKKSAR